jgi:L-cysteine:1D-myo-inositol 2-amino-2-deoxy-alpha-D-glucopyranoside ligase
MAKSRGNLVFVSDLLNLADPAAVRLVLLGRHYRHSWEWSPGLLDEATARLERWRRAGAGDGALDVVRAALDDDLDTPGALAAIDAAAESTGVSAAAALLGVDLRHHD